MEQLIPSLVGLGAVVSIVLEVLKKTSFPTDRPKLAITLAGVVIVLIIYGLRGDLVVSAIDGMVASVAALVGSAIAFYEIVIKLFKKE